MGSSYNPHTSHNPHTHQDSESFLVNILLYILKETKVPISLSFLNVTFKSSGLPWIISENFLLKKRDFFALSILGNDLKIFLRKTNENVERTDDGSNIISIINKDLTLISRVQSMLQNATSFDDFCQKHNSNKYKVNLAFIVRNSHALRLSLMNGITYINLNKTGFRSDLKEDDIWSCLKNDGFETIFVQCLKGLLENFSEPVQLGNLQSCFNFGGLVIDKGFLRAHSDTFLGDGIRGITLNKNKFEKQKSSTSKEVPLKKNNETNIKSQLQKALVDFALQNDSSIVVLGSSNQQPPLIVEALGNDTEKRLTALCYIRDYLNKEIDKERTARNRKE